MKRWACWAAALFVTCLAGAWSQPNGPHVGYVYPAGGRLGTTFRVAVGGQILRDVQGACVSGEGVRASVVEYVRPLTDAELWRVAGFLHNMVKRHWSVEAIGAATKPPEEMAALPDHPWLRDMDERSPESLARLRTRLFDPKKQPNAQIAEQVIVEIAIDPKAAPGDRELRLVTATGLTNPLLFQVGTLPEVGEDDLETTGEATAPALDLPIVLNGQILPGGVDHFRFRAKRGQRLVIATQARHLMPYLADAVPGWFQPAISLRDARGKEVAFADHYRFDPDPVILYEVPEDGEYALEIRDSVYRGREDFIYRVTVGEQPFITSLFPLGGREGAQVSASMTGWNLGSAKAPLDTTPGKGHIRTAAWPVGDRLSNSLPYAVDTLPEVEEAEPNEGGLKAQRISPPVIVNGRIAHPGDVAVFRFEGRAGDDVVAEVYARRLGSPLDSLLQLTDATGRVLAWNDDTENKDSGLLTHHADSYLRFRLPANGDYFVRLSDAQHHGGSEYGYRLRVGPPLPDFVVFLTPSSVNISPGGAATVTVQAVRKDGSDGDIDLVLPDAPAGFTLRDARIPKGQDSVQMAITTPRGTPQQVFALRVEAHAQIAGAAVSRPVTPAEDMMQAFAYRHLVPQQEILVAVVGSRPVPAIWRPVVPGIQLAGGIPIRIPLGGTVQVQMTAPQILPDRLQSPLRSVQFALSNQPRGVRLVETTLTPTGVTFTVKADANAALVGDAASLIVEASTELEGQRPGVQPGAMKQHISLGVLPAISFEIVRP
jgi:hypothetical protein